jgi:hypothetical protein
MSIVSPQVTIQSTGTVVLVVVIALVTMLVAHVAMSPAWAPSAVDLSQSAQSDGLLNRPGVSCDTVGNCLVP